MRLKIERWTLLPVCIAILVLSWIEVSFAAYKPRTISVEIDPAGVMASNYEEVDGNNSSTNWGFRVDFNFAESISTGPEIWLGNYTFRGPESINEATRREDFQFGERHKIEANRIRWHFTRWEIPSSMRGWYISGGYSYLRVNSRANRYTENADPENAIPFGTFVNTDEPDDETDLTTDVRHGIFAGFGQRWQFWNGRMTLTLGASFTSIFKRTLSIESKDENASKDYNDILESLSYSKASTKPLPEANVTAGFAF